MMFTWKIKGYQKTGEKKSTFSPPTKEENKVEYHLGNCFLPVNVLIKLK